MQTSVVFLHTNNELSETEVKKTVLLIITSKRIKYLVISLRRQKICTWKTNTNEKKLKMTKRDGKVYHAHGLEELILIK